MMETKQGAGLKEEPGRGSGESKEKTASMQEGIMARLAGGTLTGVGGRSHYRILSRFSMDPSEIPEIVCAQGPAQPGTT